MSKTGEEEYTNKVRCYAAYNGLSPAEVRRIQRENNGAGRLFASWLAGQVGEWESASGKRWDVESGTYLEFELWLADRWLKKESTNV